TFFEQDRFRNQAVPILLYLALNDLQVRAEIDAHRVTENLRTHAGIRLTLAEPEVACVAGVFTTSCSGSIRSLLNCAAGRHWPGFEKSFRTHRRRLQFRDLICGGFWLLLSRLLLGRRTLCHGLRLRLLLHRRRG